MNRFPTDREFFDLQKNYPLSELAVPLADFASSATGNSFNGFFKSITIDEWVIHLSNRMIHARESYHLMRYYFDRGIPDERPYISPGRNGASVTYFPDFSEDDHINKARFDFYADTFYYKLFSAWDTIGHILAEVHDLPIEKPAFLLTVAALKKRLVPPGEALTEIVNSAEFARFKQIRHDATHNFVPSTFGGSVTRDKVNREIVLSDGRRVAATEVLSLGVGMYVTSQEIIDVADNALKLFQQTLEAVGLR